MIVHVSQLEDFVAILGDIFGGLKLKRGMKSEDFIPLVQSDQLADSAILLASATVPFDSALG